MIEFVSLSSIYNSLGKELSRDSRDILYYLFKLFSDGDCTNTFSFDDKLYQLITVKNLMNLFSISRSTVEKKLNELVKNDFIYKKLDKSNNMYLSINLDKYKTIFDDKNKTGKSHIRFINCILENKELFNSVCEEIKGV